MPQVTIRLPFGKLDMCDLRGVVKESRRQLLMGQDGMNFCIVSISNFRLTGF
jgi:hypothetical protein